MDQKKKKLRIWGAFLGNVFEHYDTAIFTALAPFISHLFFPNQSPLASLISTYALIPLGMLARPVGAFMFGRIGDACSREKALFYSMGAMSFISFLMAFCPLYETVGIWSPVLLGIGRFLQNFAASGESMGGAIYILEQSPKEQHNRLSSLFSMTTVLGILSAALGVTLLHQFGDVTKDWRLLYLIGSVTGLFGLILRKEKSSNEMEGEGRVLAKEPTFSLLSYLWQEKKTVGTIALASGFTYSTFTVGLVLMNGFLPMITPFSKGEMIQLNVYLLCYMAIILPLFGKLASRMSREGLLIGAASMVVFTAPFLFYYMTSAVYSEIVAIRVILVTLGVAFSSSFHAWVQNLVPYAHRYLVISVGYALGTQLLGSPCSSLSLWIYYTTGISWMTCLYWVGLAAVNVVVLSTLVKSKVALYKSPDFY